MQREEFNKLSIDKQVDYFIEELRGGSNFNAICRDIGISKDTIKSRFSKEGYQELIQEDQIIGYAKPGREKVDNKTIEDVKINKSNKRKSKNNNINIDMIIKRIEKLEEEIKEIKASKSSKQVEDVNINIKIK